MSLLWTPPRKSRVTQDWQDPDWSIWAEPGMSCVKLPQAESRRWALHHPTGSALQAHTRRTRQIWGSFTEDSEPGIPVETHKKLWPVWVIGVCFWLAVGVSVWWRLR